ncbi:hypothetical protein BX600DRAFT_526921 [Xylariales sp. PMI_506]|nr:hypothetical protein BX600DRAFT_526921 [Xylariales sp. PMI_506]
MSEHGHGSFRNVFPLRKRADLSHIGQHEIMIDSRATHNFVSPVKAVYTGIWLLFAGATTFLGFRLWCKVTRRTGIWYDDYILVLCWANLAATNAVITVEMATGYVTKTWGDRMLLLITISSCGTAIGQSWSKTAFAVTLLRITNTWQRIVLWYCIISLNIFMILKIFVDFAKYCDVAADQNPWRMSGFCINYALAQNVKTAGNIYNIIMDFVLALFPWMVIWKLRMNKLEKIGLCLTMSLGIVIAIIAAVRTVYEKNPALSAYNDWYFWNQGLSMVWFSSEVAGTIIVQSIPVLRALAANIRTPLTSTKIDDHEDSAGASGGAAWMAAIRRKGTATTGSDGPAAGAAANAATTTLKSDTQRSVVKVEEEDNGGDAGDDLESGIALSDFARPPTVTAIDAMTIHSTESVIPFATADAGARDSYPRRMSKAWPLPEEGAMII